MSNSVRPHRRQPTRLPRPWDSPGQNTGVGCHFLLQCMKGKSESEVAVMSDSSRPHELQPTRLLHPWDFSRHDYWSGVPLPSPHYIVANGRVSFFYGNLSLYSKTQLTWDRRLCLSYNTVKLPFTLSSLKLELSSL